MGKCKSCGTTQKVADGMCPECMAEGGDVEAKESKGMKSEPKKEEDKSIEGEPSDDDVMSDHVAHELMESFHNKDKSGFKDALHYMVSDIINKIQS